MTDRAPVPQACPTVPPATGVASVPPCPRANQRGTGMGHGERAFLVDLTVPLACGSSVPVSASGIADTSWDVRGDISRFALP
jgi:hypothetical protein